jgi:tetratricopeptide (TPR) repeat protein
MASGVADQAELSRARQRLDAACQPIAAALQAELPHEVRAGILLAQMHARVLTGQYDKSATDWRTALDRGNYNCLSALAIYHELCRQADVPLTLWAEPGHVHCRLGELRIEPTSRQWPAPADSGSAAARQITPEQLVGRFHYNRGIELLANRDFAGGVAALHSACRLDPLDTDARANLLAGLNNWALALSADEQHAAARSLIFRGLAIDPDYAPLVANEHYLRSLVGQ